MKNLAPHKENLETSSQVNQDTNQNRDSKAKESSVRTNTQPINKSEIPMIPYNGKSPYLIAKILIIGYNIVYLKKLILQRAINKKRKPNKKHHSKPKELKEANKEYIFLGKPEVLKVFMSEDCSSLDNESIINFIFPADPKIFIASKTTKPLVVIKEKNIVFSINIPQINNAKWSQNYFAYIYYEKTSIGKDLYYYPKAICFLSDYPYFVNYKLLSQNYTEQLTSKIQELDELWLYHLVNLPSPINNSYQLSYFPSAEIQLESNKPILFNQLSGYPLMQFNLTELFNILPVDIIIKIFILTFLEQDIIFFTENLEVLNIVMYIFANLNYPLNDSYYFFNIISVSGKSLKKRNNPFLTKTFSSMIGIKSSYEESFTNYLDLSYYFIVNLEKKELLFKTKLIADLNQDIVDIIKLIEHLDNLFVNNSKLSININSTINEAINSLYNELQPISTMVTHQNLRSLSYNPLKYPDFFAATNIGDSNGSDTINRSIQEQFYYCIIRILSSFTPSFKFTYPQENKSNQFCISYNKDLINKMNLDPIEKLLIQKFSECSKYNTYIANFKLNNDCLDVNRIPLLFTEEFIHQYVCDRDKNKAKINCLFDAIDKIFNVNRKKTVELNLDYYFNWYKNISSKYAYKNSTCYDLIKYIQYEINHKKKKNQDNSMKDIFKYIIYFKTRPELAKDAFGFNRNSNLEKITRDKTITSNSHSNSISLQNNISNINAKTNSGLKQIQDDQQLISNAKCIQKRLFLNKQRNNNVPINRITTDSSSIIQKQVEVKLLTENKINRNELIFISFIQLYIVMRMNHSYSIDQLNMIIRLLIQKKTLYSIRYFVSMLIELYINIIKQKRLKGAIDDNEKQCLIRLVVALPELSCVPNEELLHLLNDAFEMKLFSIEELIDAMKVSEKNETNMNSSIIHYCHLKYNAGKNFFYKEDYFLRLAENTQCVQDLIIEEIEDNVNTKGNRNRKTNALVEKQERTVRTSKNIRWLVQYKEKTYLTPLFSPLKIYYLLRLELIKEKSLNEKKSEQAKIDVDMMNNICCNLIFYILNITDIFNRQVKDGVDSNLHLGSNEKQKQNATKDEYISFLYDVIDKLNNNSDN